MIPAALLLTAGHAGPVVSATGSRSRSTYAISGWPEHARFHIIQAFLWVSGLEVAILALIWIPLNSSGQAWSFWALVVLGICAQTNHFVAALALPKGRPRSKGNLYDWILGLVLALYVAGLVWAASNMAIL